MIGEIEKQIERLEATVEEIRKKMLDAVDKLDDEIGQHLAEDSQIEKDIEMLDGRVTALESGKIKMQPTLADRLEELGRNLANTLNLVQELEKRMQEVERRLTAIESVSRPPDTIQDRAMASGQKAYETGGG